MTYGGPGRPRREEYTKEQLFQLEVIDRNNNNQLGRDFLRFLVDDFDTFLFVYAVAGEALVGAMNWYLKEQFKDKLEELHRKIEAGEELTEEDLSFKKWEEETAKNSMPKPETPIAAIGAGLLGGIPAAVIAWQQTNAANPATNPYQFAQNIIGGIKTTKDLAWALLFLRAIFGSGENGGIMKSIGAVVA